MYPIDACRTRKTTRDYVNTMDDRVCGHRNQSCLCHCLTLSQACYTLLSSDDAAVSGLYRYSQEMRLLHQAWRRRPEHWSDDGTLGTIIGKCWALAARTGSEALRAISEYVYMYIPQTQPPVFLRSMA